MTSQTQADEVRYIEAAAAPTRFARGWHCLGLIRDFGDGKPHAIDAFGQKLVVFRGGDGQINVLDGYCRHMGGDLSQGEVKGNEIACPFHDWRWGGDGRCKQVPYARRAPKLARTATWTTLEQDGMLFVWNDPEGKPPPPEVTIPRIEGATQRRLDRLALVHHGRPHQLPRDHRQRRRHGALLLHPRLAADAFQEHLRRPRGDAVHERRQPTRSSVDRGCADAGYDVGGVLLTVRRS